MSRVYPGAYRIVIRDVSLGVCEQYTFGGRLRLGHLCLSGFDIPEVGSMTLRKTNAAGKEEEFKGTHHPAQDPGSKGGSFRSSRSFFCYRGCVVPDQAQRQARRTMMNTVFVQGQDSELRLHVEMNLTRRN